MPAETLLLPLGMAVAAGLVGCFAVMRRMTLASDALSHVALPGIGLALALQLNPVLGGIAALLVGTTLVWAVEHQTRVPTEAIIGVVFSAALAIGSMLTSGEDLIEALFGAPGRPPALEVALGLAAAALVIAFVLRARDRLVIALVSADLARTTGIDVARLDLAYLLAFAVTVALGLRYLGVLLMGSLIIIPAATARSLARSLDAMLLMAVGIAVLSTLAGIVLGPVLRVGTGPLVIAIAAGVFFVSRVGRPGGRSPGGHHSGAAAPAGAFHPACQPPPRHITCSPWRIYRISSNWPSRHRGGCRRSRRSWPRRPSRLPRAAGWCRRRRTGAARSAPSRSIRKRSSRATWSCWRT
jgi:zinc transport system permease protein